MSEHTKIATPASIKKRRLFVRLLLVLVYLGLGIFVFINGRTHTLLVDNKSLEDGSAQAFRRVSVYIDRQKPLEMYARDRELIKVRGQTHRIRIETQEDTKRTEATFTLPFGSEMVLISVPGMASGSDDFWEEFIIEYVRPTNNDAPPSLEDSISPEP